MLNPFPIQFLALLAYLILRVVVGVIFLTLAKRHFYQWSTLAPRIRLPLIPGGFALAILTLTELIVGAMFILGLYTQIAAILAFITALKLIIWHKRFPEGSIPDRLTYVLILGISLSLFITGGGAIAFDLPI